MSAKEIGQRLCDLCREGKNVEAINELYADDVVSVEGAPFEGMDQTMTGREAILGKNAWWSENNEVHSGEVQGPFPHKDDRFAVVFNYDATFKPTGERTQLHEIGIYTVANDKIAKEEFYYAGP